MPVVLLCLGWLGLVAAPETPGAEAPVAWSPDGAWIAYVLATPPPERALPPGWLVGEPIAPPLSSRSSKRSTDSPTVHRLWASHPETGEHVLLEESAGPLSAPCWSPDGAAIAYLRLGPGAVTQKAVEVVIQENPDRRRILYRRDLRDDSARLPDGSPPAWSPDGRLLAVPNPEPAGLIILRADSGRPLKEIAGAFAPAWSPDSQRLVYYRNDESGTPGLFVLNANLVESGRLLEVPGAPRLPGPVWSPGGRSLWVVLRGRGVPRRAGLRHAVESDLARLIRVDPADGRFEEIQQLVLQPIPEPDALRSISMALSADGDHLFYTLNVSGAPPEVIWSQPDRGIVQSRFHPLAPSVALHALALEPRGERLALRFGPNGAEGPVALCDPLTQDLTLLAPDAAARAAWLALLVEAARTSFETLPGPGPAGGGPFERVAMLPAPFELDPQTPATTALRRLARYALPLCDPATNTAVANASTGAGVAEAHLFFSYLRFDPGRKNYHDAGAELASLLDQATTPEARFRLLCLRAQIDLGLGQPARARQLLRHLRDTTPWPVGRLEETPAGPVLTPLSSPAREWLEMMEASTQPVSIPFDQAPTDASLMPFTQTFSPQRNPAPSPKGRMIGD